MCVWGHFKQSGKTEVWDGWELRLVSWAEARSVMTLYNSNDSGSGKRRMLSITPDPMFLFGTLT